MRTLPLLWRSAKLKTATQADRVKSDAMSLRDLALVVAGTLATLELSRTAWDTANGDVDGYYRAALSFWAGHLPLRSLPVEYPPGAVLPFALTLVPLGDPVLAFLLGAAVAFVLGYVLFVRFAGRRAANLYAVYALVGAQGTLLDRFDIFPALLTVGSLWLTQRKHFTLAYVLLAGGIAVKLYPVILIPAIAIAHWQVLRDSASGSRPAKRVGQVAGGLAVCVVSIGVSTLLPMALSPDGFSSLRYALTRPVQIESLQATIVWIGTLRGIPGQLVWGFGSQNINGVLAQALPGPALVVMLAGCAWIYLRQWRGTIGIGWAFLALLCVVVLTSKVFSTQYVVWLLPLAAETGGYELLWIAVAALTSLDYPLLYPFSQGIPPLADVWPYMLAVALRNGVLLVLTALLLFRRESTSPAAREHIGGKDAQVRRGSNVVGGSRGTRFDVAGEEGGARGGERSEEDRRNDSPRE